MNLPYISKDIPGIGGVLRTVPEDFLVEELPAYDASGAGEHLMLEVTKRGITTQNVVTDLASLLDISPETIGYAGMKDRQAVTVQRMTVPATVPMAAFEELNQLYQESLNSRQTGEGGESSSSEERPATSAYPHLKPLAYPLKFSVKVLSLHDSKMRKGHLEGNRFTIRVRQADPKWPELCPLIQEIVQRQGFPNFFGPQRFGREGNNAGIGMNALKTGKLFGPKWRKWLMVSALQSQLFNRWLEERINDGLFSTALKGDVFGRLPRGGVFVSLAPQEEQPRLDQFEISPMGPLFGFKIMKTQDEALEREMRILQSIDAQYEDFRKLRADGSRRRCRLRVTDLVINECQGDPVFSFTLPSGSYATVFLNEFMKVDQSATETNEVDVED